MRITASVAFAVMKAHFIMGEIIVMSLMPLMYFPTPVNVSKLTAEIESDDNYRYPPPLGSNQIHGSAQHESQWRFCRGG